MDPLFGVTSTKGSASLRRFPEIGREMLFRLFTLTPANSAFKGTTSRSGPSS